jgi:hypothetical protein
VERDIFILYSPVRQPRFGTIAPSRSWVSPPKTKDGLFLSSGSPNGRGRPRWACSRNTPVAKPLNRTAWAKKRSEWEWVEFPILGKTGVQDCRGGLSGECNRGPRNP